MAGLNFNSLIKFTAYLISKALAPKSFLNRVAQSVMWHKVDERFLEWRTQYLKAFTAFENDFILFPRVLNDGFSQSLIISPSIEPSGCELILLKDDADANLTFISRLNNVIRGVYVKKVDFDTQTCLGDIWDHLTYGIMLGTIAVELGNRGGHIGQISASRLKLKVKEPPIPQSAVSSTNPALKVGQSSSSKSANPPESIGPFQIYFKNWDIPFSKIEDLPHESFYVHGAHFFNIAHAAHKSVMKIWATQLRPFNDRDPKWLVDLYMRRDLLAYLLLWRRFYGGIGSYYVIRDPNNPSRVLDGDAFCLRNLAFAITAISVMRSRDKWYKMYPHKKSSNFDPELEMIWTESQS